MKTIHGKYYIADCENIRDIDRAVAYCKSLGCRVVGQYWDFQRGGEAYIHIEVSVDLFKKLYRYEPTFWFDADIRDYIKGDSEIKGALNVSPLEFKNIKEQWYNSVKDFATNIPFCILVENVTTTYFKDLLEQIVERLGCKVICVCGEVCRSNAERLTYQALLSVDVNHIVDAYRNITQRRLNIPQWISFYPEVYHYVYRMCAGGIEDFCTIVERIVDKKPLYMGGTFYDFQQYVNNNSFNKDIKKTIYNR